jgi:hypothetical protein
MVSAQERSKWTSAPSRKAAAPASTVKKATKTATHVAAAQGLTALANAALAAGAKDLTNVEPTPVAPIVPVTPVARVPPEFTYTLVHRVTDHLQGDISSELMSRQASMQDEAVAEVRERDAAWVHDHEFYEVVTRRYIARHETLP